MKAVFFPGWAMPVNKQLIRNIIPRQFPEIDIADYGFFGDSSRDFNFADSEGELRKFTCEKHSLVIGYSLGSQFALKYAANCPEVKALVILCGFAKFAKSDLNLDGQDPRNIAFMINSMKFAPGMVLDNFYNSVFSSVNSVFSSESLIPNAKRLIEGLDFIRNGDLTDILDAVKAPTLVIAGALDSIVSPKVTATLASKIGHAEFSLWENAGHALPYTHTSEVCEKIEEFVNSFDRNC